MKGEITDKISEKVMDQMLDKVKDNINNHQYIKILIYVTQSTWEHITIGVCEQVSNRVKRNINL
jgi:hypothetical protein